MFFRKYKRAEFWSWFQSNAERLKHRLSAAESPEAALPLVDEMQAHLHRYDKRLFPLMGQGEDSVFELIITAEGDADAFDSVFNLIRTAPKIDGWRFVPLKPRFHGREGFGSIKVEGHELSVDTTRYVMASLDDQRVLAVLVSDFEKEAKQTYVFMAVTLVECLLGEHDLATNIDTIEVIPISKFRKVNGYDGWPLADLPEAIPASHMH